MIITLTCDELDDNNWCFDFGKFKPIKALLEKYFDHTFLIAENDIELEVYKKAHSKELVDLRIVPRIGLTAWSEMIRVWMLDLLAKTGNADRVRVADIKVSVDYQ